MSAAEQNKVGYIDGNSGLRESVTYRTACHWIVMLWLLIVGGTLGFVGFVVFAGGWLAKRKDSFSAVAYIEGSIFLAIGAVLIARGIIRRVTTEVAVSNKRVVIRTGLFSRKSIEVLLPRVESIGIEETFSGRMLGYGTVVVIGVGGTRENFEKIRQPHELKRHVENQLSSLDF